MDNLMEKIISLCKRRGFIFPGSEIYGGLANSWDYGPLGVELKNNIKQEWWKRFVHQRTDMVGIDSALIMNPKVWEASGHLENFSDPLVECKKCHERFRVSNINSLEFPKEVSEHMDKHYKKDKSATFEFEKIKEAFTEEKNFNLMFKTFLGPVESEENIVYFRPETAQGMFVNFKNVLETTRKRLPFGIAQIGKAFRNEITPGNFIFRTREFEQMEIEYFVREEDWEKYFDHWLSEMKTWLKDLGVKEKNLHYAEIPEGERAHYSKKTIDIEYKFPFGQKELYGLAYRTDFDLKNHMDKSGADLQYTSPFLSFKCQDCGYYLEEDEFPEVPKGEVSSLEISAICPKCSGKLTHEYKNKKFIPHVIEPTWGVDRSVLVALLEAYHEEEAPTSEESETETRVVMKFPKWLAPIKVTVLPLSKKENLSQKARAIYEDLLKDFVCEYDETQSIGKRYRRQDEIGTPYCVTVDFESLEDNAVTVRDRDTMKQDRLKIAELKEYLRQNLTP